MVIQKPSTHSSNWTGVKSSLTSAAKTTRRKIEFIKPLKASNNFKCMQSTTPQNTHDSRAGEKDNVMRSNNGNNGGGEGEEGTKRNDRKDDGIFPLSLVMNNHHWRRVTRAGPGLFNHGNTCFLNSTLQCLLHTPSLVQILLNHGRDALRTLECRNGGGQQLSIGEYFQRLVMDIWANPVSRTLSPLTLLPSSISPLLLPLFPSPLSPHPLSS